MFMNSVKKIASAILGISALAAAFGGSAFAQPKGSYAKVELDGKSCGFELRTPLDVHAGESLELFHYHLNGGVRLILKHMDAAGNVREYALMTSEQGLSLYLDTLYRNEPARVRTVVTGPSSYSSYEEHTARANAIEEVQSILLGGPQLKSMGMFGSNPVYYPENPLRDIDRHAALAELATDACAYEAHLVQAKIDIQRIAEAQHKDGDWMMSELAKRLDPATWVKPSTTKLAN